MAKKHPAEQFAKFAEYVLARRPEEFGLVPDAEGFVKIKEFLKAVSETPGWSHIKRSHINEMLLVCASPPAEIADERIRAADRSRLREKTPSPEPPKLLYTCIRKKAHSVVFEKGIFPTHHSEVILAATTEMAERIGRRRAGDPVRLTVKTAQAMEKGVVFHEAGEGLYTADYIPTEVFAGPPLPKEPEKSAKPEKPKSPPAPGSFIMEPEKPKAKPGKSKPKWKKDKRRDRRGKKELWPDEY